MRESDDRQLQPGRAERHAPVAGRPGPFHVRLSEEAAVELTAPEFEAVQEPVGVAFTYQRFLTGDYWLPEAMGGGVGWLDYDGDGWLDLFFTQGAPLRGEAASPPVDVLFRNVRGERFQRVPARVAPSDPGYGMGVAVGDVDNDGFPDLYITNYGPDRLYINNGDGTFRLADDWGDVGSTRWGASAAFADLDLDGDLDLYVTNYLHFDPERRCYRPPQHLQAYCGPAVFSPQRDLLLENTGAGQYRDRSQQTGIAAVAGRGLGVVIADLIGADGLPEIFVGNDMMENFLFVPSDRLVYAEQAVPLGLAFDAAGQAQADMGIACGDVDNDGDLDLYATHFYLEYHTLWQNVERRYFRDITSASGIALPTMQPLSWGTHMLDYNGDGWLDLFIVSGHINDFRAQGVPYAMPVQLFQNLGGAGGSGMALRFEEVAARGSGYLAKPHLARASAAADYDRDGRTDVAVVHYEEPAALLRNQTPPTGAFLGLIVRGTAANRSGIGVQVWLYGRVGDRPVRFYRVIVGGGSYQAADAQELYVWLPAGVQIEELMVAFPGGARQVVRGLEPGSYYLLVEGRAPKRLMAVDGDRSAGLRH